MLLTDYRVDEIIVDEETDKVSAQCYDNIYDEVFEKPLGKLKTNEGRKNAILLLNNSDFEMTDEVKEDLIDTFKLEDVSFIADEETIGDSDIMEKENKTINVRESLNNIDIATDNKYDLRNLYESIETTADEKKVLADMLRKNVSPKKIYEKLNNKLIGNNKDVDNMKKTKNESFESNDYEFIKSKYVKDEDGFDTEYSMYRDLNNGEYLFILGDTDIYNPETAHSDYRTDSEQEAEDWFANYEWWEQWTDFGEDEKEDDIFDLRKDLTTCPNCGGDRFNDETGICIDCGYDENEWGETGTDDYFDESLEYDDNFDLKLFDVGENHYNEAFAHPQFKGPWWYYSKHGMGPGTLPKGVSVVDWVECDDGSYGTYVALDKVLTTQELKDYELKEKTPPKELMLQNESLKASKSKIRHLKEGIEDVKRILEPRISNGKVRPFGNNERLPRGFSFRSGNGASGVVNHKGVDYAYAVVDGKLRVMKDSDAGWNWSETIYKDDKSKNESIRKNNRMKKLSESSKYSPYEIKQISIDVAINPSSKIDLHSKEFENMLNDFLNQNGIKNVGIINIEDMTDSYEESGYSAKELGLEESFGESDKRVTEKLKGRQEKVADDFGIKDKITQFEDALLKVDHVTDVDFDLDGFYDDLNQVIFLTEYDIPASSKDYFDIRRKMVKDILDVAKQFGLSRTGDAIEDYGTWLYFVTKFKGDFNNSTNESMQRKNKHSVKHEALKRNFKKNKK